jgi:hypothetical protein
VAQNLRRAHRNKDVAVGLQPTARFAVQVVPAIEWCEMPIATWCLLLGLYLVLAGQTSIDEIVAAAMAAAAATLLTIIEQRVSARRLSFRRLAWLRTISDTARALLLDPLRVARSLMSLSPPPGTMIREPFISHGRDEASAGQRAVLGLSKSIAPNAYVIEVLWPHRQLLLHRLSDAGK